MSSSLFLTNCFFCGCSALILIFLLRNPRTFLRKNNRSLFIILFAIVLKLLIPVNFSFTETIPSKTILTFIRTHERLLLFGGISVKKFTFFAWLTASISIFCYVVYQHLRMKRILTSISSVHCFAENSISEMVSDLCRQEEIRKIPNIVRLDISSGPFVFGFFQPIIILPHGIKKERIKFVFLHELQHIKRGHLIIKFLMNLIFVLYWWFPIVWLLNQELSKFLECQADYYATQKFPKSEKIHYLETLIDFAAGRFCHTNVLTPLSFTSTERMLKSRVAILYDSIKEKPRTKSSSFQKTGILIALLLLLIPFFYTFEASFTGIVELADKYEKSYLCVDERKEGITDNSHP